MARFCKKTLLLLQKNALLILRRPVWLVVELKVPLVLFVVMVVMRAKYPPERYTHKEELYRPMALPSAGLLPFMQTVMCDLNGHSSEYTSDMPLFPNANVIKVYKLLGEKGMLSSTKDDVCAALRAVEGQFSCSRGTLQQLSKTGDVKLASLLKDPSGFRHFLTTGLGVNISIADALLNATVNTAQLQSPLLLPLLSGLLPGVSGRPTLTGSTVKLIACNAPLLSQLLTFSGGVSAPEVSSALCTLNSTQFSELAAQLQDQVMPECNSEQREVTALADLLLLRQIFKLFPVGSSLAGDDMLSSAKRFLCGSISRSDTSLLLLLRRVVYGDYGQQAAHKHHKTMDVDQAAPKILFTPNTPLTRSIIAKANRTFASVEFILSWTRQIRNCSQYFLEHYPPYSPDVVTLRNTIHTLLSLPALPANARQTLEQADDMLNPDKPDNIWLLLQQMQYIAERVEEVLAGFDWDVFWPVDSQQEILDLASNATAQLARGMNSVFAGVVFYTDNASSVDSLTNISFAIRMNSSFVHDTDVLRETIWVPGPENQRWKRRYLDQGFVFVQDMVERAVMEELLGHRVPTPGAYVHQMPYPCYERDSYVLSLRFMLPLLMSLAWIVSVAMTVRRVVREKELGLKEVMKMMQVSRGQLWFSWFITSFLIMFVSVTVLTLLLKLGRIFVYSDWLLLFSYLMLYSITVILYSFLCSVFFSSANTGAAVAAVLYFLLYFAQIAVVLKGIPLPALIVVCLVFPLPFALGNSYFIQLELRQKGVQFSNLLLSPIAGDPFNFALVCVMLVVDCILYMVLIWYIEAVFPGKYGVSKPWYFPFRFSYWFGQRQCCLWRRRRRRREEEDSELQGLMEEEEEEEGPVCEGEPEQLTCGIQIQGLSKTFWVGCGSKVKALKRLNLNMYEGQITAFLGHNGAGKTTTMSLLTGLFEPTQGTALVYGQDIRTKMDTIRENLGTCPQHNILFDNLTVGEHLMFFSQMKGLGYREAKKQVPGWLAKVGMASHRYKLAKRLSGGMKRKLSILLAFVGNSRTVILDEPTSGVDPFARKQIWDFLSEHRVGRTIMLSTHHMDEAEVLGDRIAIISKGSLLCCGSFEFLKHHYGHGHHLNMVLSDVTIPPVHQQEGEVEEEEVKEEEEEDRVFLTQQANNTEIMSFLKAFIPGVQLEEERGRELHYLLPLTQCRPLVMVELFNNLDQSLEQLGVQSYGLSACTMEEIFIELTQKELQEGTGTPDDGTVPQCGLPRRTSDMLLSITHTDENEKQQQQQQEEKEEDEEEEEEDTALAENHILVDREQPQREAEPVAARSSTHAGSNPVCVWMRLAAYQYVALLMKRFHYSRRKIAALIVQFVCPLLVILMCLVISHYNESIPDPPPLLFRPSLFFGINDYNYVFVGGVNNTPALPHYANTLLRPCGLGAEILDSSTNPSSPCYAGRQPDECTHYPNPFYNCSCDCSGRASPPSLPVCFNGTVTGSRVQNVMSQSYPFLSPVYQSEDAYLTLSSYLLYTKSSFYDARYGGLSFGSNRSEVDKSVDAAYAADSNGSLPFLAVNEAAKAWYSFKGYHALPTYVNVLSNAVLRANLPAGKDPTRYGIRTYSHPFPTTRLQKMDRYFMVNFVTVPLGILFALGMVAAGCVLFLIEERSSGLLHLQLIGGLKQVVYWLSVFTWDLLCTALFIGVLMLLFWLFQDLTFPTGLLGPVCLLLLCYGLAVTSWVYVLAHLFQSATIGFVMLFCLNFFLGLLLFLIYVIPVMVSLQDDDASPSTADAVNTVLLCLPVPSYPLFRGLLYFTLERVLEEYVAATTFEALPDPYSKIQWYLVALVCQAAASVVILFFIQLVKTYWSRLFRSGCGTASGPVSLSQDSEVIAECDRVLIQQQTDCPLVLKNLTKVYHNFDATSCRSSSRAAVNQLHLGLQKAECFGLLGLNGAGKTTAFRMLTGDISPSGGDAFISGCSVCKDGLAPGSIGYCPQVDAVSGALTGREHLNLFCMLRGIPLSQMKGTVEQALQALELLQYADKPVRTYSGGNRRRLSTAISLLANPPVMLLDEPTSGVDPRARQFLRHIVQEMVGRGQTVLLTTHSMAECEALCSRVGIMVNGSLLCLGSPQQLKSRYGQGYRLKVRVGSANVEQTKIIVGQKFPGAILKEEHCSFLVYQLPAGLPLAGLFSTMELMRQQLDIDGYSLSQTSLDDVFVHFANQQGLDGETHVHPLSSLPDIVLQSTLPTAGACNPLFQQQELFSEATL